MRPPESASRAATPRFLGLTEAEASLDAARYVVLPVAYEATVSWVAGTAKGPRALLEASENLELYDEELRAETYRAGIATLDEVRSEAPPEEFLPELYEECLGAGAGDRVVGMVGGEHSITFPAVKACYERYPDLTVLQLDAHADLRDTYDGTPDSHACVMRRVNEIVPIVQVGIRSLSAEEAPVIDSGAGPGGAIQTHFLHDGWPDDLADRVSAGLSKNVYITFDLDVLDPAILPATGTPEPGGLDWYRAVGLLRKIFERHHVVGFDIVELAPRPGEHASDFLAAKLLYRMIGYHARAAGLV